MTSLRRLPFALVALFAVVSLIAAFAYAINAWQVFGFARHVWRLPLALCFGAAVVADALSLAGLFATYLLRSAKLAVRAYAWFVFLLMTSLSIAAAESFAAWRRLPGNGGTQDEGLARAAAVAAAMIVVALALAVHLLIVAKRHADVATDPPAAAKRSHPDFVACPFCRGETISRTALRAHIERRHPAAVRPAGPADPPSRLPQPPAPAPVAPRPTRSNPRRGRQVNPGMQTLKDEYARRNLAGERAEALAREAGKSKRTIELWTKDYRRRFPDVPVMEAPQASASGLIPPALPAVLDARSNGHRPEVEVPA